MTSRDRIERFVAIDAQLNLNGGLRQAAALQGYDKGWSCGSQRLVEVVAFGFAEVSAASGERLVPEAGGRCRQAWPDPACRTVGSPHTVRGGWFSPDGLLPLRGPELVTEKFLGSCGLVIELSHRQDDSEQHHAKAKQTWEFVVSGTEMSDSLIAKDTAPHSHKKDNHRMKVHD